MLPRCPAVLPVGFPGRGGQRRQEHRLICRWIIIGNPFDLADQVGRRGVVDIQQPETFLAARDDVEATVGKSAGLPKHCGASDGVRLLDSVQTLLDRDHPEAAAAHRAGYQVDGQLAVSGLEDVQRKRCAREQHSAQREQRDGLGHTLTLRRSEPMRETAELIRFGLVRALADATPRTGR